MVVVEEQEQQLQTACLNWDNSVHQIKNNSSKLLQNAQRYGIDTMQVELDTTECKENVINQTATTLSIDSENVLVKKRCSDSLDNDKDSNKTTQHSCLENGLSDIAETNATGNETVMDVGVNNEIESVPISCDAEDDVITQQLSTDLAASTIGKPMEMALTSEKNAEMHIDAINDCTVRDATVAIVLDELVTTLVDNAAVPVKDLVSVDAADVKTLQSPVIAHLSADEAMELIEVHVDEEMLPDPSAANCDVMIDSRNYQWFDGEEDNEEGETIAIGPSLLSITNDGTDDVFGLESIDLAEAKLRLDDKDDVDSDGSGDTLRALKKRRTSEINGPCNISNHEDKRVRSEPKKEPQRSSLKRKRKIFPPVIPPEFAIFQIEAQDPILRGTYGVRSNRRASFIGNWGFSIEDFRNPEKISPFEYTLRTRVQQPRRNDDKHPVSGKYGGFFKLRQFNGSLVKSKSAANNRYSCTTYCEINSHVVAIIVESRFVVSLVDLNEYRNHEIAAFENYKFHFRIEHESTKSLDNIHVR
ncbi:uncharacterized protein PHALS_02753 [Plasmopara halstedii]|uniref:Uncharacterized protein n=1 Tax=Plasmopara halstedii TaxID=4781 RepID=A0A0P1AZG3_PLAHL|nr:uncharacterized protein PHALS_02753 [Plasmopara halstedii]CEG46349.1 hypothetical protein PHALS_02753 [Plasmopara halstedii]|eukprot:XP_024582718.1 hypothetical protein PHALS_02753 [Plasmopara halstedii]